MAGLLAVGTLTGCKQNTEPRYQDATKFDLNTPALANQLYQLTPEGVIDLTWSQPDWGFAAAPDYKVQIALEKEFKDLADGETNYYTCATTYHSCVASVSMEEIAIGICTLRGIKTEEDYTQEPPRQLYLRILGQIPQVADSYVTSNVICLDQVEEYCAIQSPGKIYLVGSPEGWKGPDATNQAHYNEWALTEAEDAIGSQIYSKTFAIGAAPMFRFYTALTGWDNDSWGCQVDDNPLDFELTNGEFNFTLVHGKGAFNFPNYEGGDLYMNVDMNTHKFIMVAQ